MVEKDRIQEEASRIEYALNKADSKEDSEFQIYILPSHVNMGRKQSIENSRF